MTIVDLKTSIENKTLSPLCSVWIMADYSSYFIAWLYIYRIAKNNNFTVKIIDSTKDIGSSGFSADEFLYILYAESDDGIDYKDNLIILCNKSNNDSSILFPKIEKWLFEDYLYSKVPGMDKRDVQWLLTLYEQTDSRVTKVNYDRLNLDLDKISIFPVSVLSTIFEELYNSGEYSTVSNLTIFDFTNALIKKDIKTAKAVLSVFDYIDSKPHVWLLSILLNSFYNIIAVTAEPNITAQELGISDKQLYVVKKFNTGVYDIKRLVEIYEMLTNCEYLYKFGGLSQENLSDYIICKVMEE